FQQLAKFWLETKTLKSTAATSEEATSYSLLRYNSSVPLLSILRKIDEVGDSLDLEVICGRNKRVTQNASVTTLADRERSQETSGRTTFLARTQETPLSPLSGR
ncbi:hypothetical protein WG66_001929, partial [Moniliophthora roreri]